MTARGYAAVSEKGEIQIRTVSPTERAAKVNALVIIGGVTPFHGCPDYVIDALFDAHVEAAGWRVAPVSIAVCNFN